MKKEAIREEEITKPIKDKMTFEQIVLRFVISRGGLVKQFEFEGYTRQQASYGAEAVSY